MSQSRELSDPFMLINNLLQENEEFTSETGKQALSALLLTGTLPPDLLNHFKNTENIDFLQRSLTSDNNEIQRLTKLAMGLNVLLLEDHRKGEHNYKRVMAKINSDLHWSRFFDLMIHETPEGDFTIFLGQFPYNLKRDQWQILCETIQYLPIDSLYLYGNSTNKLHTIQNQLTALLKRFKPHLLPFLSYSITPCMNYLFQSGKFFAI